MSNYENEIKYHYSSISDFERATALLEGIHQIHLPEELTLEILIRGDLTTIAEGLRIPLFLSGAVTEREGKTGPFFSGGGISRALGIPFVAISDPLVNRHDTLGLAWYTGTPSSPTMGAVRRTVTKISWFFERKILAIGGSGGGFASLSLAAKDPSVTAFVWNPQTRIIDYHPDFVKPYLQVVFGGDWSDDDWKKRAGQKLDAGGLIHDLTKIPAAENFLYLQNDTDWHVTKHYVPFVESHQLVSQENSRYSDGGNGTTQVAHFGRGHQPPSKELIQDAITLLQPDDSSTAGALSGLQEKGHLAETDFETIPADLRNDSDLLHELRMEFNTEDGKNFYCHVIHPTEKVNPLSYQFRGMQDERKIGASSKSVRTYWHWNAKPINRIECDIWDGFDHYIGTISQDFNLNDYVGKPGASSDLESRLKQ